MKSSVSLLALTLSACLAAGCTTAAATGQSEAAAPSAPEPRQGRPTAAEADAFVARAERELAEFSVLNSRAQWVNATYITQDTDALSAHFGTIGTEMGVRFATEAARYANAPGLSPDTRRKLNILRAGLTLPAPTREGAAAELNRIATDLSSQYGRGRGTMAGATLTGNEIEARMGTVRNPAQLREMWTSWNDNVGAPMRPQYIRMTEIANEGARELGYPDTGAMWRSKYDMSPDEFAALTERLWNEVRPLYEEIHCFARAGLNRTYGDAVQPATGPIRADLLGNLWAQEWGNIYDVVAPRTRGAAPYDLTRLLERANYTPERIVRQGESFFSSLGFAPLPASFWERSMITQPRDREVICHASAWDVDNVEDLRIKMCTRVNADDFITVHHELGHNYYQRAYNRQPFVYLDSANDGFHEAIGDMIALSVTPEYLVQIGLLRQNQMPNEEQDRALLLRQALDKIAFLPFGLLVDRYRWGIFSGQVQPANLQAAWDQMRLQYQGIVPPSPRTESNFDAGAKYHVPASVPYTRYFLARILQFQFYKAACDISGWRGPLHRCSFYGNREVGRRLNEMLAMGASRPWPDALEAFTGTREISAEPMVEYFRPLLGWLREQKQGPQMRLVILGLLGSTALLAGQAAAAQAPVAAAPLATGEVLLEVNALGVARTRPDIVTLMASVHSTGANEVAARAETDARLARLVAVARSMGVSAQDIRSVPVPVVYAPPAPPPPPAPPAPPRPSPPTATPAPPPPIVSARPLRRSAHGSIEVRLRDADRAEALRRSLELAGADVVSPTYALHDDRAARRAARADALATARADAEAYAASLGMRVLRMIRVTERVGLDMLSLLGGNRAMPGRLRARGEGAVSDVETPIMVGVDFVLGPQ